MQDRVRRALIFLIIVSTGTLLIFVNLPLLLILPLILAIGFLLLLLLGTITVGEIRSAAASLRRKGAAKPAPAAAERGAAAAAKNGPALPPESREAPAGAPAPAEGSKPQGQKRSRLSFSLGSRLKLRKAPEAPQPARARVPPPSPPPPTRKRGLGLHIGSFISSVKALGAILAAPKKADPDKLRKIDSLLDYAVSEKADLSEPSPLDTLLEDAAPDTGLPGGLGAQPDAPARGPLAEEDPFLSLSNDEIESGLLDELEDAGPEGTAPAPAGDAGASPPAGTGGTGVSIGVTDMPLPPQEISAPADEAGGESEQEQNDLTALEGIESVDENLKELDSLATEGPEPAAAAGRKEGEAPNVPGPAGPATAAGGSKGPAVGGAGQDAPEPAPEAELSLFEKKSASDASELAAFTAAPGPEDDMLSSLTAEIRTTKKKKDVSLLRDLEGYKVPGTEIETDLTSLYSTLNAATEKQKKTRTVRGKKPAPK